jgi:serine/threonine protein kinase
MDEILRDMDRVLALSVSSWDHFVQVLTEWSDKYGLQIFTVPQVIFQSLNVVLGQGAFATVNLAFIAGSNTPVAVKRYARYDRGFVEKSPYHRMAALRELMTLHVLRRFAGPGSDFIVQLHGICFFADEVGLVMDYISGPAVVSGQLPLMQATILQFRNGVLHQLAVALAYLHQVGAHADLKLDNLRFRDENSIVLFDFNGSLPIAADGRETVIQTGGVAGTHGYMAPEQVRCACFCLKSEDWF